MAKKILAIFLTVVTVLGLWAGCGKTGGAGNGETVTLVVRTRNTGTNADFDNVMNYVNDLLEKKIGVRIDLQLYSNTEELNQSIDLDMAAQEAIDLIWMNQASYQNYVNEAGLLPLNELLDEYAPNLKGSIREAYWNALDVDGEIYAVPNQQIAISQRAMIIQKSYADEFGAVPASVSKVEDIEPFLNWLVEKHPEVYPVQGSTLTIRWQDPGMRYEEIPGVAALNIEYNDPTKVVLEAREWYYKPTGYKYEEMTKGWIRSDSGSGVDESADIAANKYVIRFDTNRPGIEAEYQTKYGVEWIRVPVGEAYTTSTSLTSTLFGIPYTSKNPEKAVELLNVLHTDKEIFNALMYGIEGVHYEKVSENKVKVKEKSGWDGYTSAWAFGNSFLAYAYGDQPENLAEMTIALNESAKLSPIDGFQFERAGFESVIANVGAVKEEYWESMCYENSAKLYDAYIKKMKDAGIDELMAEAQKQLDEYWAEKNK